MYATSFEHYIWCICGVAIKISDHGICFWKGVPLFASVPYKGFLRYNVHVNCNRLGTYWPVLCRDYCGILLCQSGQGYGYIWQVKGYKILCYFINTADKWCLVDGQQLCMWFGTFTHTCTAPRGMVVGNRHLQGMLHSPCGRSPVSFE